ncbi:MAG: hypothetical protein ABL999_15040 [Pyrinomonadaceae bacterium]
MKSDENCFLTHWQQATGSLQLKTKYPNVDKKINKRAKLTGIRFVPVRKQSVGVRKQSVAGRKQSVAGRKQFVAGREQSVAGRKQSVGGREQSVAGRKQSVGGRKKYANCPFRGGI